MINASLKEVLEANGIKEMNALNEKFDSKLHNCLFTENNNDFEDDIILEVITKGYTYEGKVLRCATVKVNKIENINENEKENDINE